jgi:hypothetical protein
VLCAQNFTIVAAGCELEGKILDTCGRALIGRAIGYSKSQAGTYHQMIFPALAPAVFFQPQLLLLDSCISQYIFNSHESRWMYPVTRLWYPGTHFYLHYYNPDRRLLVHLTLSEHLSRPEDHHWRLLSSSCRSIRCAACNEQGCLELRRLKRPVRGAEDSRIIVELPAPLLTKQRQRWEIHLNHIYSRLNGIHMRCADRHRFVLTSGKRVYEARSAAGQD